MKRALLPLLALLLFLSACTVVGPPASPPSPAPPPSEPFPEPRPEEPPARETRRPVPEAFREVRALWVVRSTLTRADRVREMVRRADAAGFNTLLVQVRGRGDAYYLDGFEPRADALRGQPASFDPLALVIAEAHRRGIAVHAWVNTHLVADAGRLPDDPGHLLHARPDLLAVPRELAVRLYDESPWSSGYVEALRRHARANRDRIEGLYSNPAHPDVQDRIHDVWTDLAARYALDGIHFDYVRYPGPDYDYSRASLEAFRRWVRPRVGAARARDLERRERGNPLAWTEALPEEWDRFRREQITGLVGRVYRAVKAIRPELVVSAAVFADPVDAYGARYQDWPGWLDRGIVDVVVPMAYTPDDGRFRDQVARAVEAGGDPRRVWAGIGSYLTGFDGTVRKIGIARQVGAGGISLFSYDWIVGEGDFTLAGVARRSFGTGDAGR